MPLLRIQGLPQKSFLDIQRSVKRTCVELAKTYGCESTNVWATWDTIAPGHFVEGENDSAVQPAATHPPIVNLLCFEGRSPEQIQSYIEVVAKILGEELQIPGNVFVYYTEMKSGETFTGGAIRFRA